MSEKNEQKAIHLLREKAVKIGRQPKKEDFDIETVAFIKQILGPWPRSLEKAGLKEVSQRYLDKKARYKAKRKQHRRKKSKLKMAKKRTMAICHRSLLQ